MSTYKINGYKVTHEELRADVNAAEEKQSHYNDFMFPTGTVEALLNRIDELESSNGDKHWLITYQMPTGLVNDVIKGNPAKFILNLARGRHDMVLTSAVEISEEYFNEAVEIISEFKNQ